MTPKEKAKELFDLFHFPHFYGNSQWHDIDEEHTYEVQKKCALIAVDEIIKSFPISPLELSHPAFYWQEVKTEIENL